MVFSWNRGFPLEQYGDDDEPDIRVVLPPELVTPWAQWGEHFDASGDYEVGLFQPK